LLSQTFYTSFFYTQILDILTILVSSKKAFRYAEGFFLCESQENLNIKRIFIYFYGFIISMECKKKINVVYEIH